MAEAWCFKCREKKEIKNPKTETMKNGNRGIWGVCPVCNINVFRIDGRAPTNVTTTEPGVDELARGFPGQTGTVENVTDTDRVNR